MNINEINFTEEEFTLILDGLKNLPNKDMATELAIGFLDTMILGSDPEAKKKMDADRKLKREKEKVEKQQLEEDIAVLTGKIISLKRKMLVDSIVK